MASLVPKDTQTLLDLGCGTGLELDEIFKLLPDIHVTGIDMTAAMLKLLRKKHPEKEMTLICGDYFATDFGDSLFDCAVSFETMHHFSHEKKTALYRRIRDALKDGGCYIECDYMVETQAEEDHWYAACHAERRRLFFRGAPFPQGEHLHHRGKEIKKLRCIWVVLLRTVLRLFLSPCQVIGSEIFLSYVALATKI